VNDRTSTPTEGSTSSSLLRRVRNQESDAWTRLTELYGPLVYHWARRAGLQDVDATDVVQEVFRGVSAKLNGFDSQAGGKFQAWLWGITRNKLCDHFRRGADLPDAAGGTEARMQLERIAESDSDILDETAAGFDAESSLLHSALNLIRVEFEESTWTAFWRSTVEGAPTADIADSLGMTKKAVRQAKYRVLRRLRAEMDDSL
jgi:RNA polymerase sigma-70 factor (ECF subfamily)